MNLATAFADSARQRLDKTAIFWGHDQVTYRLLLDQAHRVARHLREQCGVQPGDRVGLWLKNRPEFVSALFGILEAGGIAVPINNFLKPVEVAYIVRQSGLRWVISEDSLAECGPELAQHCPDARLWTVDEMTDLPEGVATAQSPGADRTEEDLAFLIYTSGTTGYPKGAMLSHANLLANVQSCRIVLETVQADRMAVLLPMFHSFMLTVGVLLPLLTGGSIVLIRSLHPPKNIIQEILAHQATILPAIPQFFRSLLHAPLPGKLPLRLCISGAAPLPVEVLRRFNQSMSVPLIEGYGLSEASPVVSLNPVRGPWKEGSIGVPIADVEMSIQDEQGHMLPPGEIGEVCVKGPNVMLGYWQQPEESAQALRHGWLLTGDVGYHDEDGYYYITDRKKDMLLVNGINVYPREIEEVIYRFSGVREAAVVRAPDPRRGEQPVAFVVADPEKNVTELALLQFLKQNLAGYKVPRRIVFVETLPHNATGKILKTALATQAREIVSS